MRIIWQSEARTHVRAAFAYGKKVFGLRVAIRFREELKSSSYRLSTHPYIGVKELALSDKDISYRSLVVHPHYKLIYWVDEERDTVFIAALWDTRRNPDVLPTQLADFTKTAYLLCHFSLLTLQRQLAGFYNRLFGLALYNLHPFIRNSREKSVSLEKVYER